MDGRKGEDYFLISSDEIRRNRIFTIAEEVISHVKSAIMASKPHPTVQDRIIEKMSPLNKEGLKATEKYIDYLLTQDEYIKTSSEMVSGE